MTYEPEPINTEGVELSEDIKELSEVLAKNVHAVWAVKRLAEGFRYGPEKKEKETPSLVPYKDLPESEKNYDRDTANETLKAMIALGYRIEKVDD